MRYNPRISLQGEPFAHKASPVFCHCDDNGGHRAHAVRGLSPGRVWVTHPRTKQGTTSSVWMRLSHEEQTPWWMGPSPSGKGGGKEGGLDMVHHPTTVSCPKTLPSASCMNTP